MEGEKGLDGTIGTARADVQTHFGSEESGAGIQAFLH